MGHDNIAGQRKGKTLNVVIRADNGPGIGLGHFTRSTSLANEFAKQRHNVFLVTSKNSIINNLAKKTYEKIIYIENEWNIDCEEPIIKDFLNEKPIDIFLVDTYEASQNYYKTVSKYSKLLVTFDDVKNPNLYFDVLINGNIYAETIDYEVYSKEALLLLGPKHLVLRPEFSTAKTINLKQKVKNILVTFGGSDPLNFTAVILKAIRKDLSGYKSLEFNVIIGPGFKNLEEIEKICRGSNVFKLINNPEDMLKIMKKADIAISAAGSTTYELACLGIPSIIFVAADNQKLLAEEMGNKGFAINGGEIKEFNQKSFLDSLNELINNHSIRKTIHKKAIKTFSANGANRCVNEIITKLKYSSKRSKNNE